MHPKKDLSKYIYAVMHKMHETIYSDVLNKELSYGFDLCIPLSMWLNSYIMIWPLTDLRMHLNVVLGSKHFSRLGLLIRKNNSL